MSSLSSSVVAVSGGRKHPRDVEGALSESKNTPKKPKLTLECIDLTGQETEHSHKYDRKEDDSQLKDEDHGNERSGSPDRPSSPRPQNLFTTASSLASPSASATKRGRPRKSSVLATLPPPAYPAAGTSSEATAAMIAPDTSLTLSMPPPPPAYDLIYQPSSLSSLTAPSSVMPPAAETPSSLSLPFSSSPASASGDVCQFCQDLIYHLFSAHQLECMGLDDAERQQRKAWRKRNRDRRHLDKKAAASVTSPSRPPPPSSSLSSQHHATSTPARSSGKKSRPTPASSTSSSSKKPSRRAQGEISPTVGLVKATSLFPLQPDDIMKKVGYQLGKKGDDEEDPSRKPVYVVEAVRSRRFNREILQYEYELKWEGWPESDNTWERACDTRCPKLIQEYHIRDEEFLQTQIDDAVELAHLDPPCVAFHRDGFCTLTDPSQALTKEEVQQAEAFVTKYFNDTLLAISNRDQLDILKEKGFDRFKMRQHERYDFTIDPTDLTFLNSPTGPPWLDAVKQILGGNAFLKYVGCMMSLPGSETQIWHTDGPTRDEETHLPCWMLNVFVPLIDMTRALGGTEFSPGSHVLHDEYIRTTSVTPLLKAGQCLIFDYRIRHRGLGNRSNQARPVLYFSYAGNANIVDEKNFDNRRYAKLPPLTPGVTMSRKERLRHRRQKRGEIVESSSSSSSSASEEEQSENEDDEGKQNANDEGQGEQKNEAQGNGVDKKDDDNEDGGNNENDGEVEYKSALREEPPSSLGDKTTSNNSSSYQLGDAEGKTNDSSAEAVSTSISLETSLPPSHSTVAATAASSDTSVPINDEAAMIPPLESISSSSASSFSFNAQPALSSPGASSSPSLFPSISSPHPKVSILPVSDGESADDENGEAYDGDDCDARIHPSSAVLMPSSSFPSAPTAPSSSYVQQCPYCDDLFYRRFHTHKEKCKDMSKQARARQVIKRRSKRFRIGMHLTADNDISPGVLPSAPTSTSTSGSVLSDQVIPGPSLPSVLTSSSGRSCPHCGDYIHQQIGLHIEKCQQLTDKERQRKKSRRAAKRKRRQKVKGLALQTKDAANSLPLPPPTTATASAATSAPAAPASSIPSATRESYDVGWCRYCDDIIRLHLGRHEEECKGLPEFQRLARKQSRHAERARREAWPKGKAQASAPTSTSTSPPVISSSSSSTMPADDVDHNDDEDVPDMVDVDFIPDVTHLAPSAPSSVSSSPSLSTASPLPLAAPFSAPPSVMQSWTPWNANSMQQPAAAMSLPVVDGGPQFYAMVDAREVERMEVLKVRFNDEYSCRLVKLYDSLGISRCFVACASFQQIFDLDTGFHYRCLSSPLHKVLITLDARIFAQSKQLFMTHEGVTKMLTAHPKVIANVPVLDWFKQFIMPHFDLSLPKLSAYRYKVLYRGPFLVGKSKNRGESNRAQIGPTSEPPPEPPSQPVCESEPNQDRPNAIEDDKNLTSNKDKEDRMDLD